YVASVRGVAPAQYNVDLASASVVRQIFQWIGMERVTLHQVCKRLEKQGILSPSGKQRWNRSTLWSMLKNPAYKGVAAFGKTRSGPMRPRLRGRRGGPDLPRHGKSSYDVPAEQWTRIAVPPLVDEHLFEMVGQQLAENRRRSREGKNGARYLLQGLLVCKGCGFACCGRQLRRVYGKSRKCYVYHYYRCLGTDSNRHGGQRICRNKWVRQDLLEEAVWNDVRALLADPVRVEGELQRRLSGPAADCQEQADRQLQGQIGKVRRGITRLIDAYGDGLLEKGEFEPRIISARQTLAQLQKQLQERIDQEQCAREMKLVIDNLESFSREVKSGLDHADWQQRREIIRTLVKRVEIDVEQVKIVYRVDISPFDHRPERGFVPYCPRSFELVRRDRNVPHSPTRRQARMPVPPW